MRLDLRGISWVIVGGESGPRARHMLAAWARSVRDQCRAAGVPLFMKQMSRREPIPDDLIRDFPTGTTRSRNSPVYLPRPPWI